MPERPEWFDRLRCVRCLDSLDSTRAGLRCRGCGADYELGVGGVPVMMTPEDRERFGGRLESPSGARVEQEYRRRRAREWAARAWRALRPPEPVYVNPAAPPLPYKEDGFNIWLGGGGLDTWGHINVDIAPYYGVQVVANAERLPFADGSCDQVACLALLEHVPDASAVVGESRRVLRPGGRIEAVVPFCHPYHAYPSDYARFSREGLVQLFDGFEDVDIGIRTGPTTTMLTFATYYGKLLFPVHGVGRLRGALNRLIMGAAGWVMAPLAGLDRWMNRLPNAHVLANHFWVSARKPDTAAARGGNGGDRAGFR